MPKTTSTKPKKAVKPKRQITEIQRTIILFLLLAFALGMMFYIQNNVDSNFVDTL